MEVSIKTDQVNDSEKKFYNLMWGTREGFDVGIVCLTLKIEHLFRKKMMYAYLLIFEKTDCFKGSTKPITD